MVAKELKRKGSTWRYTREERVTRELFPIAQPILDHRKQKISNYNIITKLSNNYKIVNIVFGVKY